MKNVFIGIIILLGLNYILRFFEFHSFLFFRVNEFIYGLNNFTIHAILPWIFLYWAIRMVKAIENKDK
jgi:hypothetical protein